jgi:hypothetical protein
LNCGNATLLPAKRTLAQFVGAAWIMQFVGAAWIIEMIARKWRAPIAKARTV